MDIPMVDDAEWEQMWAKYEATQPDGRKAMLDEYERITGFRETVFNAVLHHLISHYGPPCPRCGKVLRTPIAFKCFECGHVVHAPNWAFLFEIDERPMSNDCETVIWTDPERVRGRLHAGDAVQIWDGTRKVCHDTRVLAIDQDDSPMSGKKRVAIRLQRSISDAKQGQKVWFAPPRRGRRNSPARQS